jgi:hypothetical protein
MKPKKDTEIIICSNKYCGNLLGRFDGTKIAPENERVLSNKLSDKKKKFHPLYCIYCHRTTRFYKKKFNSKFKASPKFVLTPKFKKTDDPPTS